jgi:hypothetical protein
MFCKHIQDADGCHISETVVCQGDMIPSCLPRQHSTPWPPVAPCDVPVQAGETNFGPCCFGLAGGEASRCVSIFL